MGRSIGLLAALVLTSGFIAGCGGVASNPPPPDAALEKQSDETLQKSRDAYNKGVRR